MVKEKESIEKFKNEVALINYEDCFLLLNLENDSMFQCSDTEKEVALKLFGLQCKVKQIGINYPKVIAKFKAYGLV